MKKKLLKIIIGLLAICFIGGLVFYYSLSPVRQNSAKRRFLHATHILNPNWSKTINKKQNGYVARISSPTLLVDDIFPSMKGPTTFKTFLLEEKEEELYWITGLKTKANTKHKSQNKSNDFICHVNLYHSKVEHFARMGMEERINIQQPQLITLTKGELDFQFPQGFGYPVFSNEKIFLGSQVLNLNDKNPLFKVDYDYDITFSKDKETRLKPLYMRYAVLDLPYDIEDKDYGFEGSNYSDSRVRCVIPNGDHHGFNNVDEAGKPRTAFWKVPKGKHTYRSDFTKVLALDTIVSLHKINSHVHPFATSLELRDITVNSTIFKSLVTNYKDRVGLQKITSFSSINGVKLYPNHNYELVLETNNTTGNDIEMMGSMFLYFYDHELDKKLESL